MKQVMFTLVLLLLLGCRHSSTRVWIGHPVGAPDWAYRYVFDSRLMDRGIVEHEEDGKWLTLGALRNIRRDGKTMKCRGPVSDSLETGYYFDFEDDSTARMTCDLFDSRFVILKFTEEEHRASQRTR